MVAPIVEEHPKSNPLELRDDHGRVMRDLRISVTDRCNFRCVYCLPETEAAANFYRNRFSGIEKRGATPVDPAEVRLVREWKPKHELLTFEEIVRIATVAVGLGINKLRVTGGEPLLRQGVERLVGMLSALPGVDDLAMTTNGFLFERKAESLRDAGLKRVSFSMDSLNPDNFRRMTGRDGLDEVKRSVAAAKRLGMGPVKVNAVVIRDLNDHEIESLAEWSRGEGVSLRFIEFMPLDSSRAWQRELVVPGQEILARLQSRFSMEPVEVRKNSSETARRWRWKDQAGEVGIIAPVTEPFCGHCNRLRLTADGKVRTCLFSHEEHDLKPWVREERGNRVLPTLSDRLIAIVRGKEAGHRIGQPDFVQPARTMSCIGG